MTKFYLKQHDSYYTNHISIIMVCSDVDITKAKSFDTKEEAQEYKDNCEMDLSIFEIVEE